MESQLKHTVNNLPQRGAKVQPSRKYSWDDRNVVLPRGILSVCFGKMSAVSGSFPLKCQTVGWSDIELILTCSGFINKALLLPGNRGKSGPAVHTLDAASVLSSPRNGERFPKWPRGGCRSLRCVKSLSFSLFSRTECRKPFPLGR